MNNYHDKYDKYKNKYDKLISKLYYDDYSSSEDKLIYKPNYKNDFKNIKNETNILKKKLLYPKQDSEIVTDIEQFQERLKQEQLLQLPDSPKVKSQDRLKLYQGPNRITLFAGKKYTPNIDLPDLNLRNGPSEEALFYEPSGIEFDSNQNLFVADKKNNCIRKINKIGIVTTYAGTGKKGFVNGIFNQAEFNNPSDVAIGANGDIFVADCFNNCIRKIDTNGNVFTVAGDGKKGFANGRSLKARFHKPESIAINSKGDIFVADTYNNCVRKIDMVNNVVTTVVGKASKISSVHEFMPMWSDFENTEFNMPTGIAINSEDDIFICDQNNFRLCKIYIKEKYVDTIFSNNDIGIQKITISAQDDIFFTDIYNNDIYKIKSNQIVIKINKISCNPETGEGLRMIYQEIDGITVDKKGNIFITDISTNTIYKIPNNYYFKSKSQKQTNELNINCEKLKEEFHIQQGSYGICWMASSLLMIGYSGIKLEPDIENFVFRNLRLFKRGEATNCPLLPKKLRENFDTLSNYIIKMFKIEYTPDNILMTIPKRIFQKNFQRFENVYSHKYLEENEINRELIYNGDKNHIQVEGTNDYYLVEIIENQGADGITFLKALLKSSNYKMLQFLDVYNINKDILLDSNYKNILEKINTFNNCILNQKAYSIKYQKVITMGDLLPENFPLQNTDDDIFIRKKIIDNIITDYSSDLLELNDPFLNLLKQIKKFNNSIKKARIIDLLIDENIKICYLNNFLLKLNFKTAYIEIFKTGSNHAMTLINCKKKNQILYCNSWGYKCRPLIDIFNDEILKNELSNFKILKIVLVTIPKFKNIKLSDRTKYDRSFIHDELLRKVTFM
jgi:hypothetical protein